MCHTIGNQPSHFFTILTLLQPLVTEIGHSLTNSCTQYNTNYTPACRNIQPCRFLCLQWIVSSAKVHFHYLWASQDV